jgi:hypothetical protein
LNSGTCRRIEVTQGAQMGKVVEVETALVMAVPSVEVTVVETEVVVMAGTAHSIAARNHHNLCRTRTRCTHHHCRHRHKCRHR